MAKFRTRSDAKTPEGRLIASRIQLARRSGATNAEIARAFKINERTVRKIVAGETPGTQVFAQTKPKRVRQSPNVFRVDIELVPDPTGKRPGQKGYQGEVRSRNIKLPDYRDAKGNIVSPTAFDIFRYPELASVAVAEGKAMQTRYQFAQTASPRVLGLRQAARYRKVPISISGIRR